MSPRSLDCLLALCGQHKPRIRHHEQRTLGLEITEILDKSKAFIGISPIPFHQLRHASRPHHVKRCITNGIEKNSFRSTPL
jgi:hypothetical protein